jgi:predicted dehydrogenase
VHSDDIRFIKERVVAGLLGRVQSLVCWANWPRGRGYYEHSDWLGHLRANDRWVLDGPATNALAHQITNMLLLASPQPDRLAVPASVRAELYAAGPITGHDTAAVEIVTAAGPTATLLVSHCGQEPFGPFIEIRAERGTVFWDQKIGAEITYGDGRKESCPAPKDMGRSAMIANFVQAVRRGDGGTLRCPLAESRAETVAGDGAHESSEVIHRIDPACCRTVEDEQWRARKVVDGLNELLIDAARRQCLLSDLPSPPPWAVATKPFDLAGYRQFPQRFRAR